MTLSELIRLVSTTCLFAVCIVTLFFFFLSLGRPREDAELVRLPPAASVSTRFSVVKTGDAGQGHGSE